MVNISAATARGVESGKPGAATGAAATAAASKAGSADNVRVAATAPVGENIAISTLAMRLSRAESATTERLQGMPHAQLQEQLNADIRKVFYELTPENKASAAKQLPEPANEAAMRSAKVATDFVAGRGANPFAGLSREQLSTIAHDDSGTFTINERRAAESQAADEEQVWRRKVVAEAMHEYNTSGKMTKFFSSVLEHFEGLPKLEQAAYPENYASDLQAKIDLDFNYFNHSAGDAGPTPGSLADISGRTLSGQSNPLFDLLEQLNRQMQEHLRDKAAEPVDTQAAQS